jgi:phytoene synthase
MAEIRLAWWREAVDEIFAGGQVRRHPTVLALAAAVRARGLPRPPFDAMIEARIGALETPRFDLPDARAWAAAAEGSLSRLAALVLGAGEAAARAEPAGAVWGLTLLRRAGKAGRDDYDAGLREALAEARRAAKGLPAAAFPAVLCATLVRGDLGRTASEVGKRARLTWAALSGRL